MLSELERFAGRTPANVVEAMKAMSCKRNLLALENPDELLHELRAEGMHEIAAYFTNNLTDDPFDWSLYESAIVAVLADLRNNADHRLQLP